MSERQFAGLVSKFYTGALDLRSKERRTAIRVQGARHIPQYKADIDALTEIVISGGVRRGGHLHPLSEEELDANREDLAYLRNTAMDARLLMQVTRFLEPSLKERGSSVRTPRVLGPEDSDLELRLAAQVYPKIGEVSEDERKLEDQAYARNQRLTRAPQLSHTGLTPLFQPPIYK